MIHQVRLKMVNKDVYVVNLHGTYFKMVVSNVIHRKR